MIVGVDEVGRGPLAGPVAICSVVLKKRLPRGFFAGVRDSKELSERAREVWFEKAVAARRAGLIDFAVSFSSVAFIDRYGISSALRAAIRRSLSRLAIKPAQSQVLLDGSLKAPVSYENQRTIIKGDEKIPVIALASIIAKVRRDRLMRRFAKAFQGYGFERHVGYGTVEHYKAIRKLGLSTLHRRSFLNNIHFR